MPTLNACRSTASLAGELLVVAGQRWPPARRWRRSSRPAARPRCPPRRWCRPGRTARRACSRLTAGRGEQHRPARSTPRCPGPARNGRRSSVAAVERHRAARGSPRRPCGAARRPWPALISGPKSSSGSGSPSAVARRADGRSGPTGPPAGTCRGTRRPGRAGPRTAGTRCSAACRTRSPSCRCAASTSHCGEVPDAPGVEALLLDDVPLVGVEQGGGDLAAVGAPADERHARRSRRPDEHLGQLLAAAGEQGGRQPGAAHQRVGHGQADARRPGTGSSRSTALPASSCTSSACTSTLIG